MTDLTQSTKSLLVKNDLNSDFSEKKILIDVVKSTEENLEKILKKDISSNLKHISHKKIIYDLLIKLVKFKEFVLLYNISKELIYEILSIGTLKLFNKDDIIYNKNNYPEYFYFVLSGKVSFQNSNDEFFPGDFFGDKYLKFNKKYRLTSYSSKDNTILLLISKEFYSLNLKNNLLKGNDKIRTILLKSFKIFRMIEVKTLAKYYKKMIKLFPSSEEIIISNKEIANAIFLIYEGRCILSIGKKGDLINLERGDIFGNESLNNVDREGRIGKNNYNYNIINKSPSSIIFKFLIKDLSRYIINGMKAYLSPYFLKREEITKNLREKKNSIQHNLKKKYDLFKRPINQKEIIDKYCFNKNIITSDKVKKSFNNVLLELRLNRKDENFKKKLIPNISHFISKKAFLKQKYFESKRNKTTYLKSKANNKEIYKNMKLNHNLPSKREIRKMIWFSDLENFNKNNNNKIINTTSNYNYSSKLLTISDNNNSNLYLTSINQINRPNENNQMAISPIRPDSNKERTITANSSYNQNRINRRLINSGISSNRCSTSFKTGSKIISIRQQIETYGCTILDTMNYFNNGSSQKYMKRNFSAGNKKGIDFNKKKIFYQTQKYNIPLYVLCDEFEKRKFPDIPNF